MTFYEKLLETLGLDEVGLLAREKTGASDGELWGLTGRDDNGALASFPDDFRKAVAFLEDEIISGKKIVVYGDYDVDGITATAIMVMALRLLGLGKNVGFYIPSRYDTGYGLNTQVLKKMASRGYGLLIAVDNGITKGKECEFLASKAIRYLILDHHEEQKGATPRFGPGLGAMYHRNDVSAAFLSLAVAREVLGDERLRTKLEAQGFKVKPRGVVNDFLPYLVTLAGLAVFSDCMPLSNPYDLSLAKRGLADLNEGLKGKFPSSLPYFQRLTFLIDGYGERQEVTYEDINFAINSKINSVARVWGGLRTNIGAYFLLDENQVRAKALAQAIGQANEEKKAIVHRYVNGLSVPQESNLVVLDLTQEERQVPAGLSGLIANTVLDGLREKKPVMVLCPSGIGEGDLVGSLRGPGGIRLDLALDSPMIKPLLKDHGGHESACGFTLPKAYKDRFLRLMEEVIAASPNGVKGDLTMAIAEEWVSPSSLSALRSLEPFGTGFPCPKFALTLARERLVRGIRGNHVFLPLAGGGKLAMFNCADLIAASPADRITCLGSIREHSFDGLSEVQLVAKPGNS